MDLKKQRHLTALIWRSRLIAAGSILGVVLALFGLIYFAVYEREVVENAPIVGVVESWSRSQTETGASDYVIDVTLENGAKVAASADSAGRPPRKGERIELKRSKTVLGRVRYRWRR